MDSLEPEHASQLAKIAKLNIKERNNRSHDVTAQSKSAMIKNGKGEPAHGLCTTVEVDRDSNSIMPKSLLKASTQKEIVSAMVKMNHLQVPIKMDNLCKLPKIPNTGQRIGQKQNLLMIDNQSRFKSIGEVDEISETGKSPH